MWAQIVCYKKSGIHWYHWHPSFLWKFNFTLVRRLISALIWDISGRWNRSDSQDFREKRVVFSRFLTPYIYYRITRGPSLYAGQSQGCFNGRSTRRKTDWSREVLLKWNSLHKLKLLEYQLNSTFRKYTLFLNPHTYSHY